MKLLYTQSHGQGQTIFFQYSFSNHLILNQKIKQELHPQIPSICLKLHKREKPSILHGTDPNSSKMLIIKERAHFKRRLVFFPSYLLDHLHAQDYSHHMLFIQHWYISWSCSSFDAAALDHTGKVLAGIFFPWPHPFEDHTPPVLLPSLFGHEAWKHAVVLQPSA